MDVITETSFDITSQAHTYEWRGYGVKLHVQQDSLPTDCPQCRVEMRASLSGQYTFPADCELVSGVFWIYCPKKFTKCAILEVQHCTTQRKGLSFFRAECSQEQLPYVFQRQKGGVFSELSSHGSIELSRFSGWVIGWVKSLFVSQQSDDQQPDILQPQSDIQQYMGQVFYASDTSNEWKVVFAFWRTLDLEYTVSVA